MSNYVQERAARVLDILEEEDSKVMHEYIDLTVKMAVAAERRRYDGPPWFWWVVGALLLGLPLAAGSHAVVGCERDTRVRQGMIDERALAECRQLLVQKEQAIETVAKACGGGK